MFEESRAPSVRSRTGQALAAALAELDPAELSAGEIFDTLADWERVLSWATARQLAWMCEIARRRPADRDDDAPSYLRGVSEYAEDEIATALRIGRRSAAIRLDEALALEDLPRTFSALEAGDITITKSRVVVRGVASLSDRLKLEVEKRVLPQASQQVPEQLRRAVERAVLSVDSSAAERRQDKARAERRVTLTPVADGMAELWALLPAADAQAVYRTLTALARADKPGTGNPSSPGRALGSNARTGSRLNGVRDRSATDPRSMDRRRADALTAMARSAAANPEVGLGAAPGASVHVTVPACVLVGCGEHLAHLRGYGPITGGAVRELAATGIWHRLLTDPVSGTLLDLGRTRYLPSTGLADHVRTRDGTCRFPGCGQPATAGDLDHTVPYADGGRTSVRNLGALCRHHHRLKTYAGWGCQQDAHSVFRWTSPTGRTIDTSPDPLP